jgi:tyrosine-protein kinase Etk/Wzc
MTEETSFSGRRGSEEEINVLRLLAVPVRRWKAVLGTVVLFVLVAVAAVALQTKRYTAHTVLVPSPDQGASRMSLVAQAQFPTSLAGLMVGGNSSQRMVAGVMRSRTLADSLIHRLGIDPEADPAAAGEIRTLLAGRVKVESNADGTIVISVSDTSPDRAARIANEFPELINGTLARIGSHAALRKQDFLEHQIGIVQDQLIRSEEQLVAFQVEQDVPEVQEQARRTLEVAASLQQRIIEQEIVVAQMRRTATPDNPELRAALAELGSRRGQLSRLTSGQGGGNQVFLSMRESPELKVAATRLLRDYTKSEQVYNSLTGALAETQIDVNNNLPVVSVLDPAIVPLFPSGLNSRLLMGMALIMGLVAGVVLAFGREYFLRARLDPANEPFFAAIDNLKSEVRGWLPWRSSAARPSRRATPGMVGHEGGTALALTPLTTKTGDGEH